MTHSSAGQWVKFFNTAGIPSPAAATYAHIFVENRIQIDMLMDLNKDYLREMGITLMGDIIAILRHAKYVNDQTAREKVLNSETNFVPVAAVTATKMRPMEKITKTTTTIKPTSITTPLLTNKIKEEVPLPKLPRRVLPEHEGKYKIKLPSGSTERSKSILAKRAQLYSDREEKNTKVDVFKRLTKIRVTESSESDAGSLSSTEEKEPVRIEITGVFDNNASIFSRLGGKAKEDTTQHIKPILKNSPKKSLSNIVKAKTITQKPKPITVKRATTIIKTKHASDNEDEIALPKLSQRIERRSLQDMDLDGNNSEKFVKFAPMVEVFDLPGSPQNDYKNSRKNKDSICGVKSRLGLTAKLHTTRKSYSFKTPAPSKRESPIKMKSIRMKADEFMLPVHKRLGNTTNDSAKDISTLSKRIGNVNITDHKRNFPIKHKKAVISKNSTSVFERLGFNS